MTRHEQDEEEWRTPANWHGGSLHLYLSRRDSRAFVPKRNGAVGGTINFAHPVGVIWLVGLIVFAVVLVAMSL